MEIYGSLKCFYMRNLELSLAKLKTYGFPKDVLTEMHSYLKNCKQKLQSTVAPAQQKNVAAGVLQRYIGDGHQLFSIFINNLFLLIQYMILV